jgi:Rieske Fe-S protein
VKTRGTSPEACPRRRALLKRCLGTCACLAASGFVRELRADGSARRFIPLHAPVVIPLRSVAAPWQQVEFQGKFSRNDGRLAIAPGMAVRLPRGGGVKVFCLYCPHELCLIDFNESRELFCTCHSSTFDPWKDGALVEGPATRGTYRFEYAVARDALRVTGIEAAIEEHLP